MVGSESGILSRSELGRVLCLVRVRARTPRVVRVSQNQQGEAILGQVIVGIQVNGVIGTPYRSVPKRITLDWKVVEAPFKGPRVDGRRICRWAEVVGG